MHLFFASQEHMKYVRILKVASKKYCTTRCNKTSVVGTLLASLITVVYGLLRLVDSVFAATDNSEFRAYLLTIEGLNVIGMSQNLLE